MPFDFGDVVLLPFPFTNQTTSKRRPAVVITRLDYNTVRPDVIVMPVTSQLRAISAFGDVWVEHWQSAGLLKPSAIKPVIATLEQNLVIRRLGILSAKDQQALRRILDDIIG